MRFRDLGSLRVVLDREEVPIAGSKQIALFSILIMNANERVPLDDLIAAGWGYDAAVSSSTVENHVWRLRRLLEPTRAQSSPSVLISDHGGYRLLVGNNDLDSQKFAALAERVRELLEEGDPAGALRCCDAALELWRGTPYEQIGHLVAAEATVGRLEELRAHILEQRIDALLRLRMHQRALADLKSLTTEFPFRERLWAHRMIGLRESGRNDEALAAYREVRELLRDELGLEPGPELQQIQASILTPSTPTPPVATRPASAQPGPAARLPRRRHPLIGRHDDVAGVLQRLETHQLLTVTGVGGCGKTRLALEVAGLAAASYPDGVRFVDFTALTDPSLVSETIASTLGLAAADPTPTNTDEALHAVVTFIAERRMLLILDNCEHVLDSVASVVDEILGAESRTVILATSREPLSIDDESNWPLAPLALEQVPLSPGHPAAVELFIARAGLESDPPLDPADMETIGEICAAVDGLPLAIELAAARVGTFTLAEIAAQVTEDPAGLSRVGRTVHDHRSTLWTTLEWSHQLLSPREQAVHRRLSTLPGLFTLPAATAVAQGDDLEVSDIPAALASLTHQSLLVASKPVQQGRPTLFRQLDTVRAHAARSLSNTSEKDAVLGRRDAWVGELLGRRPRLGEPESADWYDTLDDVYPVIRATLAATADHETDRELIGNAGSLLYYWYYRERLLEGRNTLETLAHAAAPLPRAHNDPPEITILRIALVGTSLLTGRVEQARPHLLAALDRIPNTPDKYLIDLGEALVSAGNSAWARNEYDISQTLSHALNDVAQRASDPALQLLADQVDCVAHLPTRDPAETAALAETIYERATESGNLLALWTSAAARMIVSALTGEPATGITWIDRLIPAHAHFGSGGGGAFLEALANFATLSDDPELATRMYAAALTETRRVGMVWPIQINTLELLEQTHTQLDDETHARFWAEGESLTYTQVARDRGHLP